MMKQKINLSKLFKATFLVIFLMVEFFGFGALPKAQAACSYSIQFNEFDGKTSVTPSDSLGFVTQVTRQGTTSECESRVDVRLRLKTTARNGFQEVRQTYQDFKTVSGLGSVAIATQPVSVGDLGRSQLPQANVLEFFVAVYPGYPEKLDATDVAGNVPHIQIKVTGALNSSGQVGLNVFLKDPTNNSLTTGTFKSGDAIQIMFQADPNGVQSLGGNTTDDVYISFYINDLSKPISSFTKTKGQLDKSNSQWADFTVNTASGFKDGVNTVQVKLFYPNTNVSLGQGTATVNITGLGTPVSTTPGSKANGTVCSDSPECASNFCWDQGNNVYTCAACSSDVSCNSDGPGFTCNSSGVCVKASTPAATPVGMQGNAKDKLYNPLPEEDLVHTFLLIAQGFLTILGIFAVVFIIAGGFQFVIAAGNEEAIIKGKKMITWAIIGLVVALLSFSIISIVENFLQVSIQAPPPLGYNSNSHVIARSASDAAISNKL